MSNTAVAVVFTEPGPPEVLHVEHLTVGDPGRHEVRVRVAAAGVHPTDVALRSGRRPASGASPYVPGMAIAGVVEMAGEDSAWARGDRVMGMTIPSSPYGGGYRAVAICPDDTLVAVPASVDLSDAATLPMNGHTALQILRLLNLPDGATIAVTGAAGALGSLLVPLAVSRGLRVIAVARDDDEKHVRDLGAAKFISAGPDVADRIRRAAGGLVDGAADLAVLDDAVLPAVRDRGTVATLRGWKGPDSSQQRISPVAVPSEWHNGSQLAELLDTRYLHRDIRRFSPDGAPLAHRLLETPGLRTGVMIAFE